MRLSRHATVRYWDLHAWAGVVCSLLLYVMTLTGAATLFREPLSVWEEPLAQAAPAASLDPAIDRALAGLDRPPDQFRVYLPAGDRGAARLAYDPPGEDRWRELWLDPDTGEAIPEREHLSEFLFRIHYLWHDATGYALYYAAGILALALLLAIVTGVLIHLKNLARQFHQFRPRKSQRVLWSDMHKVLGVVGLPFQLMIAYTAAFMILAPVLAAAFTGPVFDGDRARAIEAAYGLAPVQIEAPGERTTGLAAEELVARARSAAPRFEASSLVYHHRGRERGVVEVRGLVGPPPKAFGSVRLRYADGEVLGIDSPRAAGSTAELKRWVYGLHFAHFGGLPLRILFFALALGLAATLLTGNWVWLARRDPRGARPGNRLLARLTAGVGAGTPVAIAALFAASRVLPMSWSGRVAAEELTFVSVLAACAIGALASRAPWSLWWRYLSLAGALLCAVPVLALGVSDAGLFGGGPYAAEPVAVEVGLLAVGGALLALAWKLRRSHRAPAANAARLVRGDGG